MKVFFASAIALLSLSTAAADSAQDIVSLRHAAKVNKEPMPASVADVIINPKVSPLVVAYNNEEAKIADDDVPCMDELEKFFMCLGWDCLSCFIDIFEDMDEDTTCADLEASSFCADVTECIKGACAGVDCSAQATALEACAEKEYPDDGGDEDDCPGLCESKEALAVPSPDVAKLNMEPMPVSVADVIISPKVSPLVVAYNNEEAKISDDEVPCMDELEKFFMCLGWDCIGCFMDIFEDMDEDTTCADLEASSFCADVTECIKGACAGVDCSAQAAALEACAEKEYPDEGEDEDDCPGLCESEEALAIA